MERDQALGAEDMAPDLPPDMPPALGTPLLYTGESDGTITVYEVDEATLALSERGSLDRGERISFMAFGPAGDRLYTCGSRAIASFSLDATTGLPTSIAEREVLTNGNGTHLTVDATGRYIIVVSYNGGEAVVVPVEPSGMFGAPGFRATDCRNAHQARIHPSNQFAYVPCLGDDKVLVWQFDAQSGAVTERAAAMTADGAGPRHMDFAPDGSKAYVLMEDNSTIEVFDVDPTTGDLSRTQTISTVPDGVGPSKSSDIQVASDGSRVYAVNREPRHEIVWFEINTTNGQLSERGRLSTEGQEGRTIALDPYSRFLFAGYNKSSGGSGGLVTGFRVTSSTELEAVSHYSFDSAVYFVGLL